MSSQEQGATLVVQRIGYPDEAVGSVPESETGAALPWAPVLLLTAIGILNFLDRALPSVLAEPIRRDLLLSDTSLGIINGFGFLLVYAVAGVPIARLADRGYYGAVITVSLGVWSTMTAVGGLALTSWQLGATRVGVALGEAGSTPSAHAFITQHFPFHRSATAFAVLTLSAPIGSMAGFTIGGILGAAIGWRHTFMVLGAAGLILSPIVYLVMGRRTKPALSSPRQPSYDGRILDLFRKRSFVLIMLGASAVAIGGYATTAFAPAFLMRVHGMSVVDAGVRFGLASGLIGITLLLGVGWAAGRLAKRDSRWMLGVVVLMTVIGVPFTIAGLLVANTWIATFCLAITSAGLIAYVGPVVAALHRIVPPGLRARASATLLLFSAIAGGLGPLLTGVISDALRPAHGAEGLRYAMMLIPATYLISALCYYAATSTFRSDMVPDE